MLAFDKIWHERKKQQMMSGRMEGNSPALSPLRPPGVHDYPKPQSTLIGLQNFDYVAAQSFVMLLSS
jgi:hypothetical protein